MIMEEKVESVGKSSVKTKLVSMVSGIQRHFDSKKSRENVMGRMGSEMKESHDVSTQKMKDITDIYDNLYGAVSCLDRTIIDMVRKQANDFVKAQRGMIIAKKKELEEERVKYEEAMLKINKDEIIKNLLKEKKTIEEAAIGTSKELEEAKQEVKNLRAQIKTLQHDNEFLSTYIKHKQKNIAPTKPTLQPQERVNFMRRKGRSISTTTTPEKGHSKGKSSFDISIPKEEGKVSIPRPEKVFDSHREEGRVTELNSFLKNLDDMISKNKAAAVKEVEKYCRGIIGHYERKLEEMKKILLRERTKINGIVKSKTEEGNDLAEFFNCCVASVQKTLISTRFRTRDSSTERMNKTAGWLNKPENQNNGIQKEMFSNHDKQKILELFVGHPLVLDTIKSIVFPSREKLEGNSKFDDRLLQQEAPSFITEDSTVNFDLVDKKNQSCGYIGVRSEPKHAHSRPETAEILLDLTDLPRIVESDKERSSDTLPQFADPKALKLKLANLGDPKDAPAFRPQGRSIMNKLYQNYKNQ